MQTSQTLTKIYETLLSKYGKQNWWPGESRFEIIVGAILTQNTNWNNVEKALNNLKRSNLLTAKKMYELDHDRLSELIKPAGYLNIKAKRLRNFLNWLFEGFQGEVDAAAEMSVWNLREELLSIKGIGPETADSILLYAYNKPVFVVDTYTARIFGRHGIIDEYYDYEQIRDLFESNLPEDTQLYNEFHALIVQVGKEHCKPKAKCKDCPLECMPHELEYENGF